MNANVFTQLAGKTVIVHLDPARHHPQTCQIQGKLIERLDVDGDALWVVEGQITALDQHKRPTQQNEIRVFFAESDVVQVMVVIDHAGLTLPRVVG